MTSEDASLYEASGQATGAAHARLERGPSRFSSGALRASALACRWTRPAGCWSAVLDALAPTASSARVRCLRHRQASRPRPQPVVLLVNSNSVPAYPFGKFPERFANCRHVSTWLISWVRLLGAKMLIPHRHPFLLHTTAASRIAYQPDVELSKFADGVQLLSSISAVRLLREGQ
jgi:hypothetical protein